MGRYRRKALIRRKGRADVEEGWMYAIASVVTPIRHLSALSPLYLIRGNSIAVPFRGDQADKQKRGMQPISSVYFITNLAI